MPFGERIRILVGQFCQDLGYGARSFRRAPVFTLTAVIVLAIGIGVNLAEVAGFRALEHPAAVRNQEMRYLFTRRGSGATDLPLPAFDYFRRHSTVLSSVIAESVHPAAMPDGGNQTPSPSFVSGNYFAELGVQPLYGRLLDESDVAPGAEPVAVLGFSYWQREFGGKPGAMNRFVRLLGKQLRIVGILPQPSTGI